MAVTQTVVVMNFVSQPGEALYVVIKDLFKAFVVERPRHLRQQRLPRRTVPFEMRELLPTEFQRQEIHQTDNSYGRLGRSIVVHYNAQELAALWGALRPFGAHQVFRVMLYQSFKLVFDNTTELIGQDVVKLFEQRSGAG